MAEFREQDSYVNSDYDSDSEYEAGPDGIATPRRSTPNPLTNSLITQARTLVEAAEAFRRPEGLPRPRVRFVLNRMDPGQEYTDPRIEQTFQVIRDMGVDLVLGDQPRPSSSRLGGEERKELIPTRNVLLDLSVLVALCCDSTHYPIPVDEEELESRFRVLQQRPNPNTKTKTKTKTNPDPTSSGPDPGHTDPSSQSHLELAPHNHVTRDLRDQLKWEMQHSLIGELQTQLTKTLSLSHNQHHDQDESREGEAETAKVQFWVTEEVKGRLPNIVDVIGGPCEKARADAMFGRSGEQGVLDFWKDSRWKGKAPALGNMRLKIIPDDPTPIPAVSDHVDSSPDISKLEISSISSDKHQSESESESKLDGGSPPFHMRMAKVCQDLLSPHSTSTSSPTPAPGSTPTSHTPLQKQKYRFSRNPNRPSTIFQPPTKAPSGHTLNSFMAGSKRGWTVLTNNRGAVNRVIRDMGVLDGLPYERDEEGMESWGKREKAVVWIVNPNSLSEWRRLEVLESNRRLLEDSSNPTSASAPDPGTAEIA